MRTAARALLLLAALPLLMGTDIYRWVDADGVVNYTQHQPVGVAAQRVAAQRLAAPPAPAPGSRTPQPPADVPPAPEEQPAVISDREAGQVILADCDKAHTVLQQLTIRSRVRVQDADGTQRILPEEERQARIQETEHLIATHCQGTASR